MVALSDHIHVMHVALQMTDAVLHPSTYIMGR